ncbi:hypothetical protein ACIRQY_04245 [Streptomyces sp. NPDC101490]|uniref:hypothetical protein n=1 Tax=Streptomyces sp. NPDC101490 TaxID=3366143 RepID=UPI0037F45217
MTEQGRERDPEREPEGAWEWAWEHVTVNDPSGPVNNGAGAQHNHFYPTATHRRVRRGAESLRIVREDRVYLADRFVPPPEYRVAAERLEKPGSTVFLTASPGSGRRAAALMLLHELGEDGGAHEGDVRFEELPARDEGEDHFAPREGDRFLLDLSAITEEAAYIQAQRLLALRRSQVREAGAHLVAVLPSGLGHALAPDFQPHVVQLGRPRGIAVVTRYLRMDRVAFRPEDLGGTELLLLCDRSPMRELARFAGLVRTARESGRFGGGFADWLDQAMHAVKDRADEARGQVAEVRTAPERALLLAASVFEETHADTVHEAWRVLMRTVRHEEEAADGLARTDFGEHLESLGIERALDGRLRFRQLAYAEAVRAHFWTNFPHLRADFRDWIGRAAGLSGLTVDERTNVVLRFGERALAAGQPDHLFDLVVHWAKSATGSTCEPRALAALELGIKHEKLGGWFRKRMYECVRSTDLPNGLIRVLSIACLRSLGPTHPHQAMVRLRYLALRREEAASEARKALLDLVERDRRLYRPLVEDLRNRARRNPREAESPLRLLTELLGSERTPDPPPWPVLFQGWDAVFSQPPTELWNPLVRGWLDAVAVDSTRGMALGVMVRAARGRSVALHRLYVIASDWLRSPRHPSREAVADHFWQHIDHAQYARTNRPGTGPRTTEET